MLTKSALVCMRYELACGTCCFSNNKPRMLCRSTFTSLQNTANARRFIQESRLFLEYCVVEAWWPGAALPLQLGVTCVMDDQPVAAQLQGRITVRKWSGGDVPEAYCLSTSAPLPLPPDSLITHIRRTEPAAIEVHAEAFVESAASSGGCDTDTDADSDGDSDADPEVECGGADNAQETWPVVSITFKCCI